MGISSAIGSWWIKPQTVKGTAATVPTLALKAAGSPSLQPVKDRARYPATDIGRSEGPAYTASMYVSGDIPLLFEPHAMATLWYLTLGANADSGAGPNYTHIGTPATDVPYCTIWRQVGNVILEKFVDCKILRLALSGSAGGHFGVTLGIEGIKSVWEAAPAAASADPAGLLFSEIASTCKFDTVAQAIHSFSLEVNNSGGRYQADDYLPKDIDVGKFVVSAQVSLRFTGPTAFPKYREFFYGSDAGVDLSAVVGAHAFEIMMARNVNLSQKIEMPEVTYAGVPVNMDPGGDPIEIELALLAEEPIGAPPLMTVTSKDQNATIL